MKAELILRTELATKGLPVGRIAAAVNRSALELERDVKEGIQQSVPAGRTYKRSAITRKETRRNTGLGLRRRGAKLIVGYNFHRASRRGQPPAILSGRLINSIRTKPLGPMAARLYVGVNYGLVLDDPAGLDRPFFHSRAQEYRPRFLENIRRAYLPE